MTNVVKPRHEVETASGTASGAADKTARRIKKLREIRVLPLYIGSLINNDDKYKQVIKMYDDLILYVSNSEGDYEIYARESIIRRIIAEQINEFLESGKGDIKSYGDMALKLILREQGLSKPEPVGCIIAGGTNMRYKSKKRIRRRAIKLQKLNKTKKKRKYKR